MLALITAFALTGCVAGQGSVRAVKGMGLIYSHTREPLMLNANATNVDGGKRSKGSVLELQIQTLRVTWSENAIGEIAKATGIDTVYYADLEELRILGIWATHTVHIYGAGNGETIHLEVPSGKGIKVPLPKEPLVN
jgi:hypothetical protein